MHTLTRAEVARRLRKSIATVRRLEYRVLFPVRDERGIHRFDEADVERARRDPESLKLFARSRWFEDRVRDRTRRPREVTTGSRRNSRKAHTALPAELAVQLANDLQAALGALLVRFEGKHLRASGLDADLFARAFEAIRRLRVLRS